MRVLESEYEIGVDLEADSLHHYRGQVCLVQVSTTQNDWIIDPLQQDFLQPLWSVFENPDWKKIFHDADFDLRSLNRDFGLKVKNIFDTKISLELLGYANVGLASILGELFQAVSRKQFQKYQWSKRPLSHDAIAYAAGDTRYLIQLKEILLNDLKKANRLTWAEQEFDHLETIRWQPSKKELLSYWRLFDRKNLSPQYRECLRLVWNYREKVAQERDKPVFKIFHDSVFWELPQFFAGVPGNDLKLSLQKIIPAPFRDAVADLIRQAQQTPNENCPEYPSSLFKTEPPYDEALFKNLSKQREQSASQKKIDPGIIAGNKTLKKLAQLPESALADYQVVRNHVGLRPWQWSLLAPNSPSTRVLKKSKRDEPHEPEFLT